MGDWSLIGIAAALVFASAFGAWVWHLRLKNAGVIDVVWGANQALAAWIYAAFGAGWGPRRAVIALMVGLTGLRLSWYLCRRVLGHPEEGRYVALRQEWVPSRPAKDPAGTSGQAQVAWFHSIEAKFLLFFLAQALLVVLLSGPFLLVAQNPAPGFAPLEWAALLIFIQGFLGESVADAQLKAFKADPANKGRTCRDGLWRFSRHPNYFFEWLMWTAYAVMALAAPHGWVTLYAPLLMLHFLLNVTGVKYTEEQCLRSRGEDYARYQRETSAFIPWFPAPPSQPR